MKYRGVGRYVEGTMTGNEFPDEVIASFDDVARLADVFGALLVRMKLRASTSFLEGDETRFRGAFATANKRIVRPLEIEEGILEGEGSGCSSVESILHPSAMSFL